MKKKLFLYNRIRKAVKPWHVILGLVVAILVAVFLYNILGTSNVVLEISSVSDKVVIGVPFEIKTSVKNISKTSLFDAKLSLVLPDGLVFADNPDLKISAIELGEIGSNGNHEELFKVVGVPTVNISTLEPIATLSYSRGAIKAVFEQKKGIPLEIADLGLSFELAGPEEIISGEPFDLKAIYARSNVYTPETESIPVLKIRFDHPSVLALTYYPGQTEDDTPPKPLNQVDAKTFSLGALKPGDSGEINIKGKIDLPEGSKLRLTASILVNIMGRDYVIAEREFAGTLMPSPLSVALYVGKNGKPPEDATKAVLSPGDTINYRVVYRNQTELRFDNLILSVKFMGSMYDFASISVDGASWNSSTRTIRWDSSNLPELKSLAAGAAGNIDFDIDVRSVYPIRQLNDKNFSIKAEARIESGTVQKDIDAVKTASSFTLENKIAGQIKVDALGFFRDAAALILNEGPWPPRPSQQTDFTVHWVLTNYSTDLSDIEVRAQLPDGYVFTGIVKSNITSLPQFDEDTGQVFWKIDKLYATEGITSENPEAIFQVRIIPVTVGEYAPIIGETKVTATDIFTGLRITGMDDAITTRLPDDSSVKEDEGKVVN